MTKKLPSPQPVPSRIQLIIDKLSTITHEQVSHLLDAETAVDSEAGINIVKLEDFPAVKSIAGQDYSFYAARVLPRSPDNPNYVNPHVHFHGEEPYHFLAGADGEMNLGKIVAGEVRWNPKRKVRPGDTVEVKGGEVHSIRNNGAEPIDFTFACPDSHLIDKSEERPDGDRQFTKGLKHDVPPGYLEK